MNKKKIFITLTILTTLAMNYLSYNQAKSMLFYSKTAKTQTALKKMSFSEKIMIGLNGVQNPRPINHKTPRDIGLKYESHKIKVNNDVKLGTWLIPKENSEKFALMFHGNSSSKSKLLEEALEFHDMGYNTLLVDFRGSGESNQSYTSIGFFEAEDVVATYNFIQKNYSPKETILFGHSMGAAAIFRAVAKFNIEPTKIISEALYDSLKNAIKNRFKIVGLPPLMFPELMITWGDIILNVQGMKLNPIEYAKDIALPVLMLQGEYDRRATLNQAKGIFQNLPGNKNKFVTFKELKHERYIGKTGGLWKSEIQHFLK